MPSYKVLKGIDYGNGKRAEAGQTISDLPASSVSWLEEMGAIEPVSTSKKSKEEPVVVVEEIKEEVVVEEIVEEVEEAE